MFEMKQESKGKEMTKSKAKRKARTWKKWIEDAHGYIVAMEDLESSRGVNVYQERELIRRYEEIKEVIKPRRRKMS